MHSTHRKHPCCITISVFFVASILCSSVSRGDAFKLSISGSSGGGLFSFHRSTCSTASFQRPINFGQHRPLRVSNEDGSESASGPTTSQIKGCQIERVPNSLTTWTITIDGVEADLGKFSQAIYKKITGDAKQQRFQGFRPGTIPPHLEPTYRAFAMDEAAREATLEAMEQNQIRPFEDARSELMIEQVSIPPPPVKKSKKKKKKKKQKKGAKVADEASLDENAATVTEPEPEPEWRVFEDMKGAIDAGWRPGQSFSFVAKNVKGQELKAGAPQGGTPLGSGGSAVDLNQIAAEAGRAGSQ